MNAKLVDSALSFKLLTIDQWAGFESLFGRNGACGGCWCMLWRLPRKEYDTQKGEENRKAMLALVKSGVVPGILAFQNGEAIGWCAIGPRNDYPALTRSRILRPLDDRECWSVSCLYVRRSHRKMGVSVELLKAAVHYARLKQAVLLEGYPVEPKAEKDIPAAFAWTGISGAFIKAGFIEVARRSPTRPIMRIDL